MARRYRPIGALALLLAGPPVWAAHFFSMYAAETLICTGPGAAARSGQLVPVAATLTAAALAALLTILVYPDCLRSAGSGGNRRSLWIVVLARTPTALAALAMLGVLWTAFPVLLVSACAPPA